MTKSKPFRTRLKIALAVTVLFAVMGWLVVFPVYQRHRAIVEIILRVDGSIDRETSGPQWLRQWGIKFDHVDKVNLAGTNITDNGLRHFNGLTNLTALYLGQTNITDDGLKHLSRLANLESLNLSGTQISDEGLKHLSSLTNLKSLLLDGTHVSDDGLKRLSSLTNLMWLILNDTHVSDDGLQHLTGLTRLETLYLGETNITDDGLKHLSRLTNLVTVHTPSDSSFHRSGNLRHLVHDWDVRDSSGIA